MDEKPMSLKEEKIQKPRYLGALGLLIFYGCLTLFIIYGISMILGIV